MGWFDCVETRRVLATNQVDIICITKADVLSHLDSVKYGRTYTIDDQKYYDSIPHYIDTNQLLSIERSTSYELKEDISSIQDSNALPDSYKQYFEDLLKELQWE